MEVVKADGSLRLPGRVGDVLTFVSHGQTFRVKCLYKHPEADRNWCLTCDGVERARFGGRDEMLQDIGYCREYGQLPPRTGRCW